MFSYNRTYFVVSKKKNRALYISSVEPPTKSDSIVCVVLLWLHYRALMFVTPALIIRGIVVLFSTFNLFRTF